MNNYETVFIVTPVLSDAQVQEVADKFQGVITENGGQIVNKESWGLRKLAYPIQKKTTGFYFLVEFTGEGSLVNTLETPRITVTPGGWDPAARRSAPTTTGSPRERPENRSSDNCSRTTSRTAWWSWSATSAARNWGFRG